MSLLGACSDSGPGPTAERDDEQDESPAAADDAAATREGGSAAPRPSDAGTDAARAMEDAGRSTAEEGGRTNGRDSAVAVSSDAAAAATSSNDASAAQPSGPSSSQCGSGTRNVTPFGCDFAWGTNDPGTPLPYANDVHFITKWVGYEVDKAGMLARCDGCSWLVTQFAQTAAVPVYYAYFIGFFGKANGLMDQNENPTGPNLATDASQLIRDKRSALIDMYASYAKQSARVWPTKPLVWLLEGDFVQYTYKEQKGALSMAELAELARDISCAIKGNMPNAVVALNHSTWLSDDVTNSLWEEMDRRAVAYDLVWTTGVANNMGFLEKDAKAGVYNQATATFAYLAKKTGRKIFVDTSFGLSGMADTWASATAETLNARIADGVIAANVTMPPGDYVQRIQALRSGLQKVCK